MTWQVHYASCQLNHKTCSEECLPPIRRRTRRRTNVAGAYRRRNLPCAGEEVIDGQSGSNKGGRRRARIDRSITTMKLKLLSFTWCVPSPLGCGGFGDGVGRRRTVLVALRCDATDTEFLTWALVKVAAAGDRIVALHVSNSGRTSCGGEGEC
ncbi:unnamed protein product [Urochloa humidicola]